MDRYIRLSLTEEDAVTLLDLLAHSDDPIVYKIKARYLQWQANQMESERELERVGLASMSGPTKRRKPK